MIITLILALIGAVVVLAFAAILAGGNGEDVVLCEDCKTKCDLIAQNVNEEGLGISTYRCPKCGKIYKLN
jgi:heterodisulfide reductase subunit A-like polyferredoxin